MAEGQLQGRRSRPTLRSSLGVEIVEMPDYGAQEGLQRMNKQVVLLRVGIDSGCGGIQGPLFKDGSFDFVCIPDRKRVSVHTYGNSRGKDGMRLVEYFPESRRIEMAAQHIHVDPEFETFTYGDP